SATAVFGVVDVALPGGEPSDRVLDDEQGGHHLGQAGDRYRTLSRRGVDGAVDLVRRLALRRPPLVNGRWTGPRRLLLDGRGGGRVIRGSMILRAGLEEIEDAESGEGDDGSEGEATSRVARASGA